MHVKLFAAKIKFFSSYLDANKKLSPSKTDKYLHFWTGIQVLNNANCLIFNKK